MLRFVPCAASLLVASRRVAPVLAAALLVAPLAACETATPANPAFTFTPTPNRPSAVRTGPTTPAVAPPSEVHVLLPGLRPMTPWEKQYREQCQRGQVQDGCQFYSDLSLRLQGIDPES